MTTQQSAETISEYLMSELEGVIEWEDLEAKKVIIETIQKAYRMGREHSGFL